MAAPRSVMLFLAVGLVAASQSGNLIRLADAHPVVIAAWRLVIAAVLMAPLAGKRMGTLRTLAVRDLVLLALAGLTLTLHFVAWISAVQLTTVANAATFFSINPVITATAAHVIFGERISRRLLVSVALGVAGVAMIGIADLSFGRQHVTGDGLAVLCSLLFTAYFLLGKRVRAVLDNRTYVTVLYGVAGAVGFVAVAALGLPATGYTPKTWLAFTLIALVPTMVGHTALNHALRYIDAGRISTLTLSEPLLAGLVAYVAYDEPIGVHTVVGYALICLSVIWVVRDRRTPM